MSSENLAKYLALFDTKTPTEELSLAVFFMQQAKATPDQSKAVLDTYADTVVHLTLGLLDPAKMDTRQASMATHMLDALFRSTVIVGI